MRALGSEETEQIVQAAINWWELWPVYLSALVSAAGAVTSFFAPKAIEKLRHEQATELQNREHENALENLNMQHERAKTIAADEWLRDQRVELYGQWLANNMEMTSLIKVAEYQGVEPKVLKLKDSYNACAFKQASLVAQMQFIASPEVNYLIRKSNQALTEARKALGAEEEKPARSILSSRHAHVSMQMALDLGTSPLYVDPKQMDMQQKIDEMLEEHDRESARRKRVANDNE